MKNMQFMLRIEEDKDRRVMSLSSVTGCGAGFGVDGGVRGWYGGSGWVFQGPQVTKEVGDGGVFQERKWRDCG